MPAVLAAAPTTTAAPGSGQALEIAPPLIYLNVNPGQTINTQIEIRDVSNTPIVVTGEANDFVASGESGTPKVILDDTTPDPYSLKNWVQNLPTLQLTPRQIKKLPVTFVVPANASPGGHYGVIRFTAHAPSVNGGSGVALSASLGSLVLMTVSGNIKHQLSVQQFIVSHNGKIGSLFQSGPLQFAEVIKNSGNVHEQPTGLVTVTDMFGKKLATLPVNQTQNNILPDSMRRFTENLDKSVIGNKRLFGRYKASLSLTYADKQTLSATMSFWVIPYKLIAIVIAALIVAFFILRYAIKRYNRYIRNQANSGRR